MENKEFNHSEVNNIDVAKMQQENSEAYLNALRKLDQEKKDAKKAKKKKRRKKIRIAILSITGAFILVIALIPSIAANDSVSNIKDYIKNPDSRTQTLQVVVDEYIKYDLHSEEKEIKNLYKLGKKAFAEDDLETAGYLFKICAEYSEDYKDKILKDTSYESIDALLVTCAKAAVEAGNYYNAVAIYNGCEDNKSISKEIKEAKYNLAITYIQSNKFSLAEAVLSEIEGYRYSDALDIWLNVKDAEKFNDPSTARSALKARLKDPTSYEEYSTDCWTLAVVDVKNKTPFVRIKKYVSIDYSATNSFGGRMRDTYYWDADGSEISGRGYSTAELKEIVAMSSKEIIEKAKSAK